MEVDAVREWAEVMNDRGWQIDIHTVRKNPCEPPDCLAEMDGNTIGVEVTELVYRGAIEDQPAPPCRRPLESGSLPHAPGRESAGEG